jgi:Base plate wedge protein 53
MAKYSASSPWYNTIQNNLYLEYWQPRPIPAAADDFLYTIQPQYNYRPDLLAYDIYGNPHLWWVFMQRNVDIIFDPIYDFKAGTMIRLPKKTPLLSYLGLGG